MEKWVEDFARCEELVEEIFEKVSLVISYKNKELEKGTPLEQKQVEKTENWEKIKTLMQGGEEKVKKEQKKLIRGGGEQKSKQNGGRENVEQSKRLENGQKTSRIHRMRKPDRLYCETKIINGGKFKIQKCA